MFSLPLVRRLRDGSQFARRSRKRSSPARKRWAARCSRLERLEDRTLLSVSPQFEWAFNVGSWAAGEGGTALTTDAAGNIYMTGAVRDSDDPSPPDFQVDLDPGPGEYLVDGGGSFAASYTPDGRFRWAVPLGGNGPPGYGIATGAEGDVYVSGWFRWTGQFGDITLQSRGQDDIFVTKLNATTGEALWATRMGGEGLYDHGNRVAVDDSGNAYVTGCYYGQFTAGDGNDVILDSKGYIEAFVAKLDPANGDLVWAKSTEVAGATDGMWRRGGSVAVDGSGNVWAAGFFNGQVDFDPDPQSQFILSSKRSARTYSDDFFVWKLDATNGEFRWAGSVGGTGSDAAHDISIDQQGNAYITGSFDAVQKPRDQADFDPGPGTYYLQNAGETDGYVLKLDNNGEFRWAKSIGGPNADGAVSNALDSLGNVYVCGRFYETADLDPGPDTFNVTGEGSEIYLEKLDSEGNFVWGVTAGGPDDVISGTGDAAWGITIDGSDNVYASGHISSDNNYFGDVGPLHSAGGKDIFLSKVVELPDDAPRFTIDDVTLVEGDTGSTEFLFTVSRSQPTTEPVTVDYATADGSATAPDDYSAIPTTTLNFASGETSKTIAVTVYGGTGAEPHETLLVNLSNPTGGAVILDGTGVGTILNDDDPPTLRIGDVQQLEGDSGQTMFEFPVTATRPDGVTGALTVQVDYVTADGTALSTAGDYDPASGTLTIDLPDGQTEATQIVSVPVNGDDVAEAHEDFFVNLSNPVGGVISDGQGVGTILNDDVSITIDDVTVTEGDASVKFLDAFVSAGSGGLNRAKAMVLGPNGTLYVASGATDSVLSYDSTTGAFIDVLVTSGSGGLDNPSMLLVRDGYLYVSSEGAGKNAPLYSGSVLRYDASTGDPAPGPLGAPGTAEFIPAGSGVLDIPTGLLFDADGNLYVGSYRTHDVLRYDGSTGEFKGVFVTAGSGGLAQPMHLRFGSDADLYVASFEGDSVLRYQGPDGVSPGTFIDAFVPQGSGGLDGPRDPIWGPDGNLYVGSYYTDEVLRYDGTTGAFIDEFVASGSGGLDIPRDLLFLADGNLYVTSNLTSEVLRYGPASQAVFTVSLSGPSAGTVTVDFDTTGGTATAGSDYIAGTGTLTFEPGVTSRTIVIPTIDDTIVEADETFLVNLSDPTGGAIIGDGQGEGTIVDNDSQSEPHVFYSIDTPLAIADAHPKKGPKTTTSELDAATHDLIQSLSIEITLDGSSDVSDLGMVLASPDPAKTATITPVFGTSTLALTNFDGDDPFGTWTLAITDYVKGNTHTLTGWSLTINDSPQAAAATDMALLAWVELDSSDDEDTDPLASQIADELVLMLME